MTARLYYADSYLTEFEARVLERGENGRRVYLDRTAFYPTSGGQAHDLGTLGGVRVADVVDEGERILHVLEAPLDPSADVVSGAIDWERRFDHMQQHTGQHLLSAILAEVFCYATVSVHFGPRISTLDLDVETVSPTHMVEAEARANSAVFDDRPVSIAFEDATIAAGLRKASQRAGELRVVSIEGLDRSACGGTHVRGTGEIGAILLRRTERVRKSARIEFVCGARAVRRSRADFESLAAIAASMSASLDEAPALVAARLEQLKDSDSTRRRLERELAGFRARALYDAAPIDTSGVRQVVVRNAMSVEELRALAQAAIALPRILFVGAIASQCAILLAASEDSGVDAGGTLRAALAQVGGRGGGSPRVAQGSVRDPVAVDAVVSSLLDSRSASLR